MTTELRDAGTSVALSHAGEAWRGLAQYFVYRYLLHVGSSGCLFEEARAFAEGCFKAEPRLAPTHGVRWRSVCPRRA